MNYFAIATKHDGSFEFIEKSKEDLLVIMNKMSNQGSEDYKEIRVFSYSKYTTKRTFKKAEAKPKPQAKAKNG